MKTQHKIFFAQKKQRKILLARGLSIRQLPALGCWNVTLLLLLLLQKKCEYHRTRCDCLVAAACQDGTAWNERKKTTTFLSAGCKYGLRFDKKLCTHVQVLGGVAMGKDEGKQRRILIFGAPGYFKLRALLEGRGGRFSDSKSAPVPNVWIRVRKIFKFENPTPVQTSTANDATEIQQCFY